MSEMYKDYYDDSWFEVVTIDTTGYEVTREYDNIHVAQADFMYFTQEANRNLKRVILRAVDVNYDDNIEDISILDEWSNKDYE